MKKLTDGVDHNKYNLRGQLRDRLPYVYVERYDGLRRKLYRPLLTRLYGRLGNIILEESLL